MTTNGTIGSTRSSTLLYLVRHGETDFNRRGIVQGGGIDSALNDTGYAQAEALADRLADEPVDAIYASTMRRARQTADVLSNPHEPVSKTYLRDLEEMAWGVFEGEPPSEERDEAMDAIKRAWRSGEYDRTIQGGESIADVESRARRAMNHIVSQEAGNTVVVVTHGRYLRVLLATFLDGYELTDMAELDHSNTCVNRVAVTEGRYQAELLNCTAHLASGESSE